VYTYAQISLGTREQSMRSLALVVLLFCASPALAQEGAFDPGCTDLPFTALHHPIDDDCGIEGS
jgi:hypothetical protein